MVSVVYLLLALVLSLLIIPQAMRIAPILGMLDRPDPRKVHAVPVARVGGIGIVVGAVIALLFAVTVDDLVFSYILGAIVLFVFGMADDRFELGHYTKFIGQFVAVGLVVFVGDLYVTRLPLIDQALPEVIAIPFTIIAMVGVINAFNHADGLDGLAGGEALLSLLAGAAIAYWSGDLVAFQIALVAIGGLIGFLRYNNHPARVFMGDAGSQYLGFTVAFLAVELTQVADSALSAALPLLLIGLPVIDILTVFYLRISGGMHWFKASRNHFHHRLLDLGFVHAESVVVIYSVQFLFALSAVVLRYHMDTVILGVYFSILVVIFGALIAAERRHWRMHQRSYEAVGSSDKGGHPFAAMRQLPTLFLLILVPAYFFYESAVLPSIDESWLGVIAILSGLLLLGCAVFADGRATLLSRVGAYCGVLLMTYGDFLQSDALSKLEIAYFAVIAVTVVAAVQLSAQEQFRTNPLDYLIGMVLIGLLMFQEDFALSPGTTGLVMKSVVLLYAVEFLINRGRSQAQMIRTSLGIALGWVALRSFLG